MDAISAPTTPPPGHIASLAPGEIKLWPLLVQSAIDAGLGGAIRVWLVARLLMRDGSGLVEQSQVTAFLDGNGVHERTRRRWTAQALELGLLIPYESKKGVQGYKIKSVTKTAQTIGCSNVGSRPVAIFAKKLLQKGWRSYVWAAYLACFKPLPVSRAKKAQLSGVARRTQIGREKNLPLIKTPTFTLTGIPATSLAAYRKYVQRNAFAFRNPAGQTVIAYRMPDIVSVPLEVARTLPKGRTKIINHTLADQNQENSSNKARVSPEKTLLDSGSVFFEKQAAADKKCQRVRLQPELFQQPVQVVYVAQRPAFRHPHTRPQAKFWEAMPV